MEVGILPCILLLILAKEDDVIELRPVALPLWVLTTILEVPPAGTVWPLSTIPAAVNQTTIDNYHWSFWSVVGAIFIWILIGFASLRYTIGLKITCHFFIQSEVKPKPIVNHSQKFSCALRRLYTIYLFFIGWLYCHCPLWLARLTDFSAAKLKQICRVISIFCITHRKTHTSPTFTATRISIFYAKYIMPNTHKSWKH